MNRGLVVLFLVAQSACVSDAIPPPDGGKPSDAAADAPAADAGVAPKCLNVSPMLFAAIPDAGPFCPPPPGNHCARGVHCCNNAPANTRTCAPTCAAGNGVIDVVCFNTAECPMGQSCCGDGLVKTGVCSYAVVTDLTRTFCQTSCTGYQACGSTADCAGGKVCTPAFPYDPKTGSVYPVHLGVCQ